MKPLLTTTLLLLVLATPAHAAEVRVVTTLADLASITREVGGDRVKVESIVDGRQDPHYVEILPSYMLKVKRADLFVQIGLDLELWAPGVIDGARNRDLRVVDCSQAIQILERPAAGVDASQGDIHVGGNPHYWLDPANGGKIAEAIAEGLVAVDPEGADHYRARLEDFRGRLTAAIAEWTAAMAPHRGTPLVYFHNSWPYFNHAFGLVAADFVEPKPGVSPGPGHTATLIQTIRSQGIRVIAMSPYFDRKVCESIARQSGAQLVVLASSVGGVEGADDYFSLFETNLARLRAALGDS